MPTLASDLIQQAFEDLAVVQPGEIVSATLQANGFLELNQLLQSLGTEGASVFTETTQTFAFGAAQANYTLGTGGNWQPNGGLRAQKVIGWKAVNGIFTSGGSPLP